MRSRVSGTPCLAGKLKLAGAVADAFLMFLPSKATPPQVEAALQAFCAAMNTPVVNVEELTVGPARAAILLCANEYAGLDLMVCVRTISTGNSIVYQFQGDPEEFGTPGHAIEAAVSFAEGMGFLFDEELIESGGTAGRRRAWKIWMSMIGSEEAGQDIEEEFAEAMSDSALDVTPDPAGDPEEISISDPAAVEIPDASDDDSEDWMLEDEVLELDAAVSASGETASAVGVDPSPTRPEPKKPVLTKFRKTSRSAAIGASGRTELGALGLDRVVDETVFEEGGDATDVESIVDGEASPARDPSQSARFASMSLASESVGSEVSDATDFLTQVLSSF